MSKPDPKWFNADGSFKGGFDGCCAFMQSQGHDEASARKVCMAMHPQMMQARDAAGEPYDSFAVLAAAYSLPLPAKAGDPLPTEIVWMPKGTHAISAFKAGGGSWQGAVTCDESGAVAVQAQLAAVHAAGGRVWLDKGHQDDEATAWVLGFRWDPAEGIVAQVSWSALGEELLRGKVYYSFSPAFLINKKTGRVSGFQRGHAAGGLVNAPAFGAAMPALIAARLGGDRCATPGVAESVNPAPGGSPGNSQRTMKDLILAILAALSVQVPADASDEQVTGLLAAHKDQLTEAVQTNHDLAAKVTELDSLKARAADAQKEHDELVALRARESDRRKADAKAAVDAAVARGALPAKDEAVQAKWRGLVEADPSHAELLASMPANPALTRVTSPGQEIQVQAKLLENLRGYQSERDSLKRGVIYARHLDAEVAKLGNEFLAIMAANSLGTMSSQIILQRFLSLLKFRFPFLSKITTNFSSAGAYKGQQITTRLRAVPTVLDYDATTGYTTRSDATTTDVNITIDKHKYCAIEFTAEELGTTARDLFGEQSEPQLYAMGYQFVKDILALIVEGAAAFGAAGSQATEIADAAAFNAATLDTVAAALDGRMVSPVGRFSLLDSSLWPALRGDTRLVYLAGFQDRSLIQSYDTMPPVSGFDLYNAPFFPQGVVVNTSKALHGFCGTSESLAVAARVPNDYTDALPGASNGRVSVITEPDSKLSMALVQYVNHDIGSAIQRVALMYGGAIGNPKTGQLIAY